jgi:hypothetical protein
VLTLLVTIKHWLGRPIRFLAAGVALVLLMYGYIYVVSPWTLADLMATTASRLLLHIAPLACFFMAESARAAGLLAVLAPFVTGPRDRLN